MPTHEINDKKAERPPFVLIFLVGICLGMAVGFFVTGAIQMLSGGELHAVKIRYLDCLADGGTPERCINRYFLDGKKS